MITTSDPHALGSESAWDRFSVSYRNSDDGLWFPVAMGTSFASAPFFTTAVSCDLAREYRSAGRRQLCRVEFGDPPRN